MIFPSYYHRRIQGFLTPYNLYVWELGLEKLMFQRVGRSVVYDNDLMRISLMDSQGFYHLDGIFQPVIIDSDNGDFF